MENKPSKDVKEINAVIETEDPGKEMVKIRIRKDKRVGGDLFVSVNDHNYLIKRGETVEVPRYIAEVIENSVMQDERTEELIETFGASANWDKA